MTQIITNNGGGGSGVGVYKYKGSVNSYEDLPSSGMKIGDVYNVVNEHTTAPVFPAGTNVAWTGTEWDALGGSIDFSEYQKKLVEGAGIDIDGDTNEISVESTIINGAAAGATAVQPGDDISDLNNDAGYITSSDIPTNVSAFNNDAGYLVSSDLKQSDWGQTDSSKIDYIKNKPTIGNATLTIQKNGTTVNSITMNATSNVTANISVPTKTSDINNDSGFITSSDIPTDVSSFNNDAGYITSSDLPDLSGYQLKSNLVTDLTNPDNTHYPSALAVASAISSAGGGDVTGPASSTDGHLAVFDGATGKIIKDGGAVPTPTTVVDALDSTSTTSALSANQGKVLKGLIDNLAGLGKFLSLWNSKTGQPISFPLSTPYTYTTGDWYMVETVDTTTNYKPNGSSYTGTASTTTESGTVKVGDVYIYDGTDWLLQVNNEPQISFSDIAGNATDNTSLSNALNAKANDSDVVKLTGNQTIAGTKTFSTSPVVPSKTTDATNTGTAIATEAQVYKKQDKLTTQTAYTSKGTSTKVPQITTNNLGQVTGITEVDIEAGETYTAGNGIEIGDDYSAMQGPAPSGFHVPLTTEWQAVYNIWTALGGGSSDGTNFVIALKLPFAGNRSNSTSNIAGHGSNGLYWSSSRSNANNAYYLSFNSSSVRPQGSINRAYGLSVRCFKDTPVVPTSSWTKLYGTSIEAGGIFWSSTDGLISLSSDGTTWITIADKNLGATSVWNSGDTLSETNCGKYYQWGNNYGFPRTGTIANQSTTQVDASNYGPGNYYSSDTFIKNSGRWDSTDNGNLRGGVKGVIPDAITNTGVLSVNGQTGNVSLYSTITVTLTSAGWSSNSQTVSATGVTASNTVIVSPAPSDIADYADCGVYCSAQGSGTLTFGCDKAPSGDIVVNVLIFN